MNSENMIENNDEAMKQQPPEETEAASALQNLSGKPEEDGEEKEFEIPQRFTKSGRKRAVPFPLKLMKVLSNKEFEHIITWMPSGKSFSIVEPKAFVAEILPEHFKSAKYASFTRKLHRWGFLRHYRGEEAGAFYHKNFQKDRPDLVDKMTCHKVEPQAPQASRKVLKQIEGVAQASPKPSQAAIRPVQKIPAPQPSDMVSKLQQQLSLSGLSDQMGAAERLNAAIELEVARRLKERIQAAALSRHTLAFMNQFTQAPANNSTNMYSVNGNLQAQFLQMQQRKQQLELASIAQKSAKQQLGVSSQYASDKGLQELPHTNIQGAKTA